MKAYFDFNARLAPEDNTFRRQPEEFHKAKEIVIPLGSFVALIQGDLGPMVVCTLERVTVSFHVNNGLVKSDVQTASEHIDVSSQATLPLHLE